MKSILDTTNLNIDKSKERIFFGEYSGFQRYDNPTYKIAVQLEERQRNSFWNPNEVSLSTDSQTYFDMPEDMQDVMQRIWLFQTLMDSAQNTGLENVIAELCTNSEFEAMFKTWGYFELIHSLSYSHILRGIFTDASKVFNKIEEYPEIQQRINKEIQLYNKVKNVNNSDLSLDDKKKLLVELLVNVFALEGVKFYISFLVTYIINNSFNNKIQGATRIIKLINFDEDIHTSMCSNVLSILSTEEREGFTDIMNSDWYRNMVKSTFETVYSDEVEWAKYLLSIGNIPTLTEEVSKLFLQYFIDQRLGQLNMDPLFNSHKTDVVQWFESYKNMDKDNIALQESDLSVYSVGIMQNDISDGPITLEIKE